MMRRANLIFLSDEYPDMNIKMEISLNGILRNIFIDYLCHHPHRDIATQRFLEAYAYSSIDDVFIDGFISKKKGKLLVPDVSLGDSPNNVCDGQIIVFFVIDYLR